MSGSCDWGEGNPPLKFHSASCCCCSYEADNQVIDRHIFTHVRHRHGSHANDGLAAQSLVIASVCAYVTPLPT